MLMRARARTVLALLLVIVAAAARAQDGLTPGDVLDASTWQKAEKLLPPEILQHYRDDKYKNTITSWPQDRITWPEDFKAGTDRNAGRFKIGPEGEILDKATGKQPDFIIGHPFPTIDPADPTAGVQVVWNYFYRTFYFGNLRAESQLNMMNPSSLERRIDVRVLFMYYDGIPERERARNPQNFLYQQLVVVTSPADVNGTQSLSWRYRDPRKRDQSWAYVPALRRVRAVSPANRSDGFLGSDMSQDDGPFFDGKPEDFEWKFVGETEQLRLVDPGNLEKKVNVRWLPSGGWRADWPDDFKFLGYMDPQWKGLAWAPIGAQLARRKFYVVEGVPKDKYYLFGKLQLIIDQTNFAGSWNRKSSWKGEPLSTTQVIAFDAYEVTRPDGKKDWVQGSSQSFQCSENLKLTRATVAGIKSSPTSGFDTRIVFDPSQFALESLSRYGK
jgi:hypothetical protein